MAIVTFRISVSAIAAVVLTLNVVGCSAPESSSGQAFATDGDYLSRTCGPPQLKVEDEKQAAV